MTVISTALADAEPAKADGPREAAVCAPLAEGQNITASVTAAAVDTSFALARLKPDMPPPITFSI
jgi:hypothetical protein